MEEAHSLYELNEFIRQALELNFEEPLWIHCEIAQIGESKGHRYITLVQKAEYGDQIMAQSKAVIWRGTYESLRLQHRDLIKDVLQEGAQVSLLVRIDFHERYGLKLLIEGIDPSYTMGQLALKKQQTIERLAKEDLLVKNSRVQLPTVIQRLAIISSETAAGYIDFIEQLRSNPYGYSYDMNLFPAAVQGVNLVGEFNIQLERIYRRKAEFDAIIIIRGGGGKMDLSGFDDYSLCAMAAKSPIPVITGIGHEVDETILDLVAHTSLKTPTAVAEFLINNNLQYESSVLDLSRSIQREANWIINGHWERLIHSSRDIQMAVKEKIRSKEYETETLLDRLKGSIKRILLTHNGQLLTFSKLAKAHDPSNVLRRGYSMTLMNGKAIIDSTDLQPEDIIETTFLKGKIKSKVVKQAT